jgi:hypothetical protein
MVFSGHTTILVLCGMAFHTYWPSKPGVFTVNWVKTIVSGVRRNERPMLAVHMPGLRREGTRIHASVCSH